MHALIKTIPSRALFIGLGAAAVIYLLWFGFVLLRGGHTIREMETALPSQIVVLENPDIAKALLSPPPSPEKAVVDQIRSKHGHDGDHHAAAEHAGDSDLNALSRTARNANSLLPAPYDGLTEETSNGLILPRIGPNQLTPFQAYKKPFIPVINKPAIAVVIQGVGMADALSQEAMTTLPSQVTLMLSPYADHIDDVQIRARENGFETWLHVPMENEGFPADDPGPRSVLSKSSIQYNQDNVNWVLSRAAGYAGVAVYTDRTFLETKPVLQGVLFDLFSRGLGLFEMNPHATGLTEALSLTKNAPFAKHDIQQGLSVQLLEQNFAALKDHARENGRGVAVFSLNPAMMRDILPALAKAEQEGFQLVPLSALAE